MLSDKIQDALSRIRRDGYVVGVYSQRCVILGGATSFWEDEDGQLHEVTDFFSTEAQARMQKKWKDLIVVARLVKFVRAGRPDMSDQASEPTAPRRR